MPGVRVKNRAPPGQLHIERQNDQMLELENIARCDGTQAGSLDRSSAFYHPSPQTKSYELGVELGLGVGSGLALSLGAREAVGAGDGTGVGEAVGIVSAG